MEISSFNIDFSNSSFSNKDVLSAFKGGQEKTQDIQQGMSIKEISEIVSDRIILVVKEQFEATKVQFENKAK